MPIDPEYYDDIITALGASLAVVIGALASAIVLFVKTRADLKGLKASTDHIKAETSPNHGGSMKDKLDAAVVELGKLAKQVDQQRGDTAADIRGLRRDIGRLADTDREDRETAVVVHQQIYDAMEKDRNRVIEYHEQVLDALRRLPKEGK